MKHMRKIRHKLLAAVLIVALGALFISAAIIAGYALHRDYSELKSSMTIEAKLVSYMTVPALTFDDRQLASANLSALKRQANVRAAAIYDKQGKVFASYSKAGTAANALDLSTNAPLTVDWQYLTICTPLEHDGSTEGALCMRIEHGLAAEFVDYALTVLIATAIAMLSAYLLMARISGLITGPIASIADTARQILNSRDYSRRAERRSRDEIGDVVDSFNAMMTEIEHAQQEVLQLNTDLEKRVKDRTLQLERSNSELTLAKEAADNANRAKSEFLSSMSHELRTPLNAILGFGQLLASNKFASTDVQKHEFAERIVKAGRLLLELINEILDLAKIESGNITLSIEAVDVGELFDECRVLVEPLAQQYGVSVWFPPDVRLSVEADRIRTKQVLLNLLSNAIKYNRQGGTVAIHCDANADQTISIAVRDSGRGLSETDIADLFQPFNRLGQEAGEIEGTGIGLVVTKQLIDRMGGEIAVASTPGVGSTFTITLPRAEASSDTEGAPDGDVEECPAEVVGCTTRHTAALLYVEDNPSNVKLVEEIVRARGDLAFITAADASLGTTLAKAHRPRVILMDINLPGMSGLEALGVLHGMPDTRHIPIIALTANATPADIARGLGLGFFRYLTKPIDIEELMRAIDAAILLDVPRPDAEG